jgi:hypothetical protein
MSWRIFPVSEFLQFEKQWDALNAKSANNPLLDGDFVALLLKNFSAGEEQLAVFGDLAQAMAIVKRRRPGVWESFQPSQAPIGLWLADRKLPWQKTLPSLQRALPGCVLLGINQLDPDDYERPGETPRVTILDYIQTARITIDKPFKDYWKARGKNLRHNMKRQRGRLADEGIATRLEIISDPEHIDEAVLDYAKLESAGWKAGGGTAIAPGNAQHRFYSEMLKRYSARGEACIYRYFFGDRLVASDLCLHSRSALIVLKTTYAESEKTSSPALLMREEAFARLFAQGRTRRIEFYGKVMDWHTKWSDEIRTLYHINCYRFGWLRRLHKGKLKHAE